MKTKMLPPPTVLLDIVLNGRFLCQLPYRRVGHLEIIDGKPLYVCTEAEVRSFVESKRPSLIGKDFKVELSNQRVI